MSRFTSIVMQLSFLALFIGIIFFANKRYQTLRQNALTTNLVLNIKDSLYTEFVTTASVTAILDRIGIRVGETLVESLPLQLIEDSLAHDKFIDKVNVYSTILGDLVIDIEQFPPIMRMVDEKGNSYFVDKGLRVVPHRGAFFSNLPVVTQSSEVIPAEYFSKINIKDTLLLDDNDIKGLESLKKVVDFVDYIKDDDIYSNLFTQINISEDEDIELYPRVGNHYILFSSMDSLHNYERTLNKLDKFYKSQSDNGVWSEYTVVDLKYRDQVVCKRRKK